MPIIKAMPQPASAEAPVADGLSEQRRRVWARRQETASRTAERIQIQAFRDRTQEQLQRVTAMGQEMVRKIAERNRVLNERVLERQRKLQQARSEARATAPAFWSEVGAMADVGLASYAARRITDCPIVEEFAMALGGQYGADLGRRLAEPRGD